MGRADDRSVVVDSSGCVCVLAGLRIVDALIIPMVPRANISAIVLAEKFADENLPRAFQVGAACHTDPKALGCWPTKSVNGALRLKGIPRRYNRLSWLTGRKTT
jgi:hypothetical protein